MGEVPVREALVLVLGVGGAVFDLRTRRIPNLLTLPLIALGLLLSAVPGSGPGPVSSVLSVLATIAVGLPASRVGLLGGGDVKMLAAIGALLGHGMLLQALLWTAVIGGAVALLLLASRRALLPFLRRLVLAGYGWARWGVAGPVVEGEGHRIPLGVVIAAGTVAALVSRLFAFDWMMG